MTPHFLLLSFLVLLRFFSISFGNPLCNSDCCRFVETFPVRLRQLRRDFSHIKNYYEVNNDLDSSLLGESVENSFKSPFACQAMNSILDFYLRTVLPTAVSQVAEDSKDLKPHVESIQLIFDELKREVTKCKKVFSCKDEFNIQTLNSSYAQMQSKGIFKAMGELDQLFNFIEKYLASELHSSIRPSKRLLKF